MSRKIVRFLAGFAIAASVPAVAQAQGCVVQGGVNTSCFIERDATLSIPSLAFINFVNAGDIVLATPASWSAFLTGATVVTTETAAPLVLRANTTFGVTLTADPITGGTGRSLTDHGFKFSATGTCTPGGFTPLSTTAATLIAAGSAATNGTDATLCLESTFDPAAFTTNMAVGEYVIPLTLTISAP